MVSAVLATARAAVDMERLRAELRTLTRPLSTEQILDLADVLHEIVRERRTEERSFERTQARLIY